MFLKKAGTETVKTVRNFTENDQESYGRQESQNETNLHVTYTVDLLAIRNRFQHFFPNTERRIYTSLCTVESRLTATLVIRSPRYYGHYFSAGQNDQIFACVLALLHAMDERASYSTVPSTDHPKFKKYKWFRKSVSLFFRQTVICRNITTINISTQSQFYFPSTKKELFLSFHYRHKWT